MVFINSKSFGTSKHITIKVKRQSKDLGKINSYIQSGTCVQNIKRNLIIQNDKKALKWAKDLNGYLKHIQRANKHTQTIIEKKSKKTNKCWGVYRKTHIAGWSVDWCNHFKNNLIVS